MFWISKIYIQIPYLVLIKRFQNPKLCQNKPLCGVKTTFKKGGIWKSFVLITSLSSKLLAYSNCFENLAPISKCYLKRCFKPSLCVLENFEKSSFLSNNVFQKKKIYENPLSKLLQNALQMDKKFLVFPKIQKTTSKGTLFSNENYFKLLPYLAKRKYFVLGWNLLPKIFLFQKPLLKKVTFQNCIWACFTKYWCMKIFSTRFKLASQKPWITKAKWFQNEFGTWFAWVSKAHLRNILSSKN